MPRRKPALGSEQYGLISYRRVAARLHPIYLECLPFFSEEADGSGIPDRTFLELLIVFRLVYLKDEEAHFRRVRNRLHLVASDSDRKQLAEILECWEEALETCLGIARGGVVYGPEAILNIYMNGLVFHQEEAFQADLTRLREVEPIAKFNLQFTVLRLVGCVLAMDEVVARQLRQDRLVPDEQNRPPYLFRWPLATEFGGF